MNEEDSPGDAASPTRPSDPRTQHDASLEEAHGNPAASLIGERIGSCRILSTIAQGGMGVVYEAEQESPSRRVALKVLRGSRLSRVDRRRFEYEREVLAGLFHRGIAQVYEVGTHELDGEAMPYFVMELVVGARSIVEYVQQESLPLRPRVELCAQIAEIVHHGHQRGVIHRDLKPGNILVDRNGHPKLIDFGIARAVDTSSLAEDALTLTGQIIGTPQYMSPEQCSGQPQDVDSRSDVYSLGVVLYEVLCDALPYPLDGCTLPELILRIREAPPKRPSTLRAEVRGDLETVVFKALAKEPDARYASAAELASDLRRYLAGEPILARPASVQYQLRLFAKRHRSLVAGVLVAAIALVFATVLSAVFAWEARQAERRERDRASAETRARERAERLFAGGHEFARWALDDLNRELGERFGATEARVDLLERVRRYLETLGRDAQQDSALLSDIARAWTRIGDTLGGSSSSSLGRPEPALEAYSEAIRVNERRLALSPGSREVRQDLVELLRRRVEALVEIGDLPAADVDITRARSQVDDLLREFPSEVKPHRLSIEIRLLEADALLRGGDSAGAEALLRETVAFGESAGERLAKERPFEFDTAYVHAALGDFLQARGRHQEAAAEYQTFDEQLTRVVEDAPENLDATIARTIASQRIRIGDARWHFGDIDGALAAFEASRDIDRRLLARDARDRLAESHYALSSERVGNAYEELGKLDEAIAEYRRAVEIRTEQLQALPGSPSRLWAHAIGLRNLGAALRKKGQLDEAHRHLLKALAIRSRLADENPDNSSYVREHGVTAFELATLTAQMASGGNELERFREAKRLFEQAATRLESLRARDELAASDEPIPAASREAAVACEEAITQLESLDSAPPR